MTTLQAVPFQETLNGGAALTGAARDAMFAARIVAGDERALGQVYDEHCSLVYGLARRVTQNEVAAQDITQDVFGTLWERPDRFDPARGTLRAYLGVLTHRRAVDWIRRESATKAREERDFRRSVAIVTDSSAQPVADDTAARIRACVDALPPDQRETVLLAYFGGHTYREVADILNIPEGTAKSRLRLALSKLSTSLTAQGLTSWT